VGRQSPVPPDWRSGSVVYRDNPGAMVLSSKVMLCGTVLDGIQEKRLCPQKMRVSIHSFFNTFLGPVSTDVICSCRYEIVFKEVFCIEYLNEWAIWPDIPDPVAGNACHMPASPGCPCHRPIRTFSAGERPWCPGQRVFGIVNGFFFSIYGESTGNRYRYQCLFAVACSGRA